MVSPISIFVSFLFFSPQNLFIKTIEKTKQTKIYYWNLINQKKIVFVLLCINHSIDLLKLNYLIIISHLKIRSCIICWGCLNKPVEFPRWFDFKVIRALPVSIQFFSINAWRGTIQGQRAIFSELSAKPADEFVFY